MIDGLVKILPQLGVHAYELDTGSDSYNVVLSSKALTDEELGSLYIDVEDSDLVNI
ncbi:MAG: hypothetical protein ACXAC5_03465 [Promethearchaeota archaeon]